MNSEKKQFEHEEKRMANLWIPIKKQLRLACLYQEKHSHITQKNG